MDEFLKKRKEKEELKSSIGLFGRLRSMLSKTQNENDNSEE